jgi:hypothetical protein
MVTFTQIAYFCTQKMGLSHQALVIAHFVKFTL